ncbi:hypothetical protein F4777DRAFT_358238 [Nemania sp. FL0916]|nr:hypothetical protein F4777DRAFT_358238 [Nemania sp. FL0916]
MSGRSVLSAMRAGRGGCEATTRQIAGYQQQRQYRQQHQQQQLRRGFTTTAPRKGTIASFTPTDSPELDAHLQKIRTDIILPSYLPEDQRRMLRSRRWEKKLQHDPITMEIDGEVFKFGYTPSTPVVRPVLEALNLFKSNGDYVNLKPLCEGLAHRNSKTRPDILNMAVRQAGEAGQIWHVIDCARNVRTTAFKFNNSERVLETLHAVQMKAHASGWDETQTRQALRWAEMVVDMLHEPLHQEVYTEENPCLPGDIPLNRDPLVLIAPLHLAAMLALRHSAGEEVADKMAKFARDVVAVWPAGKKSTELYPPIRFVGRHRTKTFLNRPSKFVSLTCPLLHGLHVASQVVEPELADQLRIRRDTLAAEIKEARDKMEEFHNSWKEKKIQEAETAGEPFDVDQISVRRGQLVFDALYEISTGTEATAAQGETASS